MWKVVCPNCHHPFSVVLESSKEVFDQPAADIKENSREKIKDVLEQLIPSGPMRTPAYERVPGSLGDEVSVDEEIFEYNFKCKHCGYEWTETKEKEVVDK